MAWNVLKGTLNPVNLVGQDISPMDFDPNLNPNAFHCRSDNIERFQHAEQYLWIIIDLRGENETTELVNNDTHM